MKKVLKNLQKIRRTIYYTGKQNFLLLMISIMTIATLYERIRAKIAYRYAQIQDTYRTNPKKFWIFTSIAAVVVVGTSTIAITQLGGEVNQHGSGGDELNLDDLLAGTDEAVEKEAMISCLKKQGVEFYGGASCGFSCADVNKYGKDMKNFSCIDCDIDPAGCEAKGVADLPVWRNTEGKKAQDITSLSDLAGAFGCN